MFPGERISRFIAELFVSLREEEERQERIRTYFGKSARDFERLRKTDPELFDLLETDEEQTIFRRVWLLFIDKARISILLCAFLGVLFQIIKPFSGTTFWNFFPWFYELPIILILFSAALSIMIKKDIHLIRRPGSDKALRIAAEWILEGFGAGVAFFYSSSIGLGKFINELAFLSPVAVRLVLFALFIIIPFFIIPSLFLIRIYKRQASSFASFLVKLLGGTVSFCLFFGFVLFLLMNSILLMLLLLGALGLSVT